MQDVKEAVERMEPTPEERGDWDAVRRDARGRRRPTLLGSVAGVAVAAAALFALVLFEPWAAERRTFLERALAAVDDGPVIHAFLRHSGGGMNVDLETGERTPVYGGEEIWYDPQRKRIRVASRLGGTVTHESVYEPGYVSRELVALGRDYKAALEAGSARIAGGDVIDGERVTWVVVESQWLPDSSDGKLHEWSQQVAVSNETFKPVAIRDMRDGRPGSGNFRRVLELEALPEQAVDLSIPSERIEENSIQRGHEAIALDRAADVLGRAPVWLGLEHAGLRLTQAKETWIRRGRQKATRLEGQAAEDAKSCRLGPGGPSRIETPTPECARFRTRLQETRGGFRSQGNTVYEYGPVMWGEQKIGVSFTYGDAEDPFRPLTASTEPYVHIAEAVDRDALLNGAGYFPPPGVVSLSAGSRSGSLVVDGIYVVIHASSPELILPAARALKPMP